ncbi:response regulator [Candidatus Electronema sp. JM]|uniref:response regulator n=1 Tax=Candidatus Electronema sp. JM TaxID=3401571 RepID=UPI003AA8AE33
MSDHANDLILIVDDQPASLKILLSFLQDRNFELRVLPSGAQALAALDHFTPDIILLDVLMPEMDGFETCRRMRKRPELTEIPIIFMTALSRLEDKVEGFAAGGVDYITKPFQQVEVLARISTQLSLRRKTLKLKAAQETLLHQKTMLEALLDSIPDPIYFKDLNNCYLGCNRAFEQFAGKAEAEILGRTDSEFLPPVLAASFRSHDAAMLADRTASRNEEELTGPDNETALYDVLKSPYIGPDGGLLGLIGICRNITELKKAERQAEEERERLSVTLHSIGDGVIATDVLGRISYCNKVAEQLTGWSLAEAADQPSSEVFRIINEKTEAACADPVRQVLELGRAVTLDSHTALIRRDGSRLSIADSCAPIHDRAGRLLGTVIVFRDVTNERKITEEMLKIRKLESVGLLAAGIAHDFNNILTAILGNIELAGVMLQTDSRQTAALLTDAQKAAIRAAKLTRQLLTFAKGGEPVKEAIDLAELVQEAADFVLLGSSVSCDYTFADQLRLISADSSQISQVIQNIVLNAKQAMPEGGKIQISCVNVAGAAETVLPPELRQGDLVRITIQDRGRGIPPHIIDKIFDPFFSTKPEGSGLGLAICHSVIMKHGGWIAVQSELGRGTMFAVYLPAAKPDELAAGRTIRKEEAAMKQTALIMVMDDEPMLRDLAKAQLHALGHEAVLAADGEEAAASYARLRDEGRPVDLVIMDLTIPGGMGGIETARLLLELDPAARLIVASGYSNDPVLAEYRKYGFRAAVAKPFSLNDLRRAIAAALQSDQG